MTNKAKLILKTIIILLTLTFYSCKTDKKNSFNSLEVEDLLQKNEYYSAELLHYYEDEFYTKKEKNPFRSEEITKWQNLGYKIAESFKTIHNLIDTNNFENIKDSILPKYNQAIIFSKQSILKNIENPILLENARKELPALTKNDSINLSNRINQYTPTKIKLKLINESLISTNLKLLSYCLSQAPSNLCGYSKHSLIVSIDKEVLQKGQNLKILAGVGELSNKTRPQFFVNGKKVNYNQDLIAESNIQVPNKIGSYQVQVKVVEKEPNGETRTSEKTIHYKVVDTLCK